MWRTTYTSAATPERETTKNIAIIYVEPLREMRTASASFVQEYNEKRFLYFQLAYNIINIINQICYLQGVFYGFEFVCQPLYFSCQIICTFPSLIVIKMRKHSPHSIYKGTCITFRFSYIAFPWGWSNIIKSFSYNTSHNLGAYQALLRNHKSIIKPH